MSGFLERRARASGSQPQGPSEPDLAWQKAHAFVHAFLTDLEFGDGTARLTASLTIFVDDGVFKACLNDRQEGEALWASGAGLLSLLDALELSIKDGTGEWRRQRRGGQSGRPGKRGR